MKRILEYRGLRLEIPENVYFPSDDTYLLIENLRVKSGDRVLEIGTGSGLVALIAAETAEKVIATDISPIAVKCAKKNIQMNHLSNKVEVREGNLFDPVIEGEKFDLILFNPPYLPEPEKITSLRKDWLEIAWNGGRNGRNLIDPFIKKCKTSLKQDGIVQLVQSSFSDIPKTCQNFRKCGLHVEIVAKRSFFFEKIVIINARKK
ncbi:MAG: HemK2/MTQ2 family protein methyltransferase [Candidatus Helarchaeota archaeon]